MDWGHPRRGSGIRWSFTAALHCGPQRLQDRYSPRVRACVVSEYTTQKSHSPHRPVGNVPTGGFFLVAKHLCDARPRDHNASRQAPTPARGDGGQAGLCPIVLAFCHFQSNSWHFLACRGDRGRESASLSAVRRPRRIRSPRKAAGHSSPSRLPATFESLLSPGRAGCEPHLVWEYPPQDSSRRAARGEVLQNK